jgi:hypothetical protein
MLADDSGRMTGYPFINPIRGIIFLINEPTRTCPDLTTMELLRQKTFTLGHKASSILPAKVNNEPSSSSHTVRLCAPSY